MFNNLGLRLSAALAGFGLAYLPEDQVKPHLSSGALIRVLKTGAHPIQVTIYIIRAGDNLRRPSPC